jgi:hypothetical protein
MVFELGMVAALLLCSQQQCDIRSNVPLPVEMENAGTQWSNNKQYCQVNKLVLYI